MTKAHSKLILLNNNNKIKIAYQAEPNNIYLNGEHAPSKQDKIIEIIDNIFEDAKSIENFENQLNEQADQINIEKLWLQFHKKIQEPQDLRDFLYTRYKIIAPFYIVIRQNFIYFNHTKQFFSCRSLQEIENIKISQQNRQEKNNFYNDLTTIIKTETINKKSSSFFTEFVEEVKTSFYENTSNKASKLLEKFNPWELPADWASFKLLQKNKIIPANSNFFIERYQLTNPHNSSLEILKDLSQDPIVNFSEPIITIDDEETRDMDDAVTVKKTNEGYQVTIFITNITAFIAPDCLLDKEAYKRASSIYMPDIFINMFPNKLVYEKFALRQNQLCPTLAYQINIDNNGKKLSSKIFACQVKVTHRLSFTKVNEMLQTNPQDELSEMSHNLFEVAVFFAKKRQKNNALMMQKPYLKIRQHNNKITIKKICQNSPAYFLISELMISTNTLAANYCNDNKLPCFYKSQSLIVNPNIVKEDRYNPIIFRQLTKQIKKTSVSTTAQPHQGLGCNLYTQTTSPIRRYSDFIIQRQIIHYLTHNAILYSKEKLERFLLHINKTMPIINEAQNKSNQFYFFQWLKNNLQQSYRATVITQRGKNYVIELNDFCYILNMASNISLQKGQQINIEINQICPYKGFIKAKLAKQDYLLS